MLTFGSALEAEECIEFWNSFHVEGIWLLRTLQRKIPHKEESQFQDAYVILVEAANTMFSITLTSTFWAKIKNNWNIFHFH